MRSALLGAVSAALFGTGLAMADGPPPATMPAGAAAATIAPTAGSCCDTGCCATNNSRVWFTADYLLWWFKSQSGPALATTGPALPAGTALGALGSPGTSVLFSGSDLTRDPRSGGRFFLGGWLNDCQTVGVEAGFFFIPNQGNHFNQTSGGTPIIARPFFNVLTGLQDSEVIAAPGAAAGTLNIASSSRMWGTELNGLWNVCNTCTSRVSLLGGVRFLKLDEDLTINENVTALVAIPAAGIVAGTTFGVRDAFSTRNDFYGGQIGVKGEWNWGKWGVDLLGKVALGDTHETVHIDGSVLITPPGGVGRLAPGGLLALPSNIGTYTKDAFAVVPEVGINLRYNFTEQFSVQVGYTFLYWSNVARPGNQIDTNLDTRQIPTSTTFNPAIHATQPAGGVNHTDFWAQGVNFGFQFKF